MALSVCPDEHFEIELVGVGEKPTVERQRRVRVSLRRRDLDASSRVRISDPWDGGYVLNGWYETSVAVETTLLLVYSILYITFTTSRWKWNWGTADNTSSRAQAIPSAYPPR